MSKWRTFIPYLREQLPSYHRKTRYQSRHHLDQRLQHHHATQTQPDICKKMEIFKDLWTDILHTRIVNKGYSSKKSIKKSGPA